MFKWSMRIALLLSALAAIAAGFSYSILKSSLPSLDGDVTTSGVSSAARLQRDRLGVVNIVAQSKNDAAYVMGYAHAQDRLFQMDLSRRMPAGELSELFGAVALETDKKYRLHQMRSIARQTIAQLDDEGKALLTAYAKGVNDGIESLGSKPFEYWLTQSDVAPWLPEDSLLVSMSMFVQMTQNLVEDDFARDLLLKAGGEQLLSFLQPEGTQFDSAIDNSVMVGEPIPSPEQFSLVGTPAELTASILHELPINGSNSWVIHGSATANGRALFSNDPHLGFSVPNIWYRAQIQYPDAAGELLKTVGVSVPGLPAIAIGSNGHVSWGMTNSAGDWADYIELDLQEGSYQTVAGAKPLEGVHEVIKVRGEPDVNFVFERTQWGPVIDLEDGRKAAYRWMLHYPRAINALPFLSMDQIKTVDEGVAIAHQTGLSPFNIVLADVSGDIRWTILGQMPKRGEQPTERVVPWQQVERSWQGWLAAEDFPVVSPTERQPYLWTANNRIVGGDDLSKIGVGTYELGARAKLIELDLADNENYNVEDMHEMLQNHKAIVVASWRDHVIEVLSNSSASAQTEIAIGLLKNWSAMASVDDAGFTIAHEYRKQYFAALNVALNTSIKAAGLLPSDAEEVWLFNRQSEGAVAYIRDSRPAHWLPGGFSGWASFEQDVVAKTIDAITKRHGSLAAARWGKHNALQMHHPLASALPSYLANRLNMPVSDQAGGSHMPLAQHPRHGQSMRFVVQPGHESEGYLTMPGGQSGHPLSDHYGSLHSDWVLDNPSPLVPGEVVNEIQFVPVGS